MLFMVCAGVVAATINADKQTGDAWCAQRRPDGQSIDCFMHANPFLHNRGLAMVFNPASTAQSIGLQLPLYYTGVALWRLATLGRLVCCPPPLLAEVVVCRDHNGGDGFG